MNASRNRAGVTMVELLVGIGVGVAIFILLLAVLDQATKLSERSIAQESLWREAIGAAQTVEQALQGYASPKDLKIKSVEMDVFGRQGAEFYSVGSWAGAGVLRIKIGAPPDEGPTGLQMTREAVGADSAKSAAVGEEERSVLFESDEAAAKIQFRYAYKIGKNLKPDWTEQDETGKQPLLVQYTVTVSPKEPSASLPVFPVQLTGAVALGS